VIAPVEAVDILITDRSATPAASRPYVTAAWRCGSSALRRIREFGRRVGDEPVALSGALGTDRRVIGAREHG
jgi:hypothetical protein